MKLTAEQTKVMSNRIGKAVGRIGQIEQLMQRKMAAFPEYTLDFAKDLPTKIATVLHGACMCGMDVNAEGIDDYTMMCRYASSMEMAGDQMQELLDAEDQHEWKPTAMMQLAFMWAFRTSTMGDNQTTRAPEREPVDSWEYEREPGASVATIALYCASTEDQHSTGLQGLLGMEVSKCSVRVNDQTGQLSVVLELSEGGE